MGGNLQGLVDSIVASTPGLPDPDVLAAWSPALSGDIDIVIQRDGRWWHSGSPIVREGLVRLFASLLRREDDGHYYLVTPVEKWRLHVAQHPLVAVDCDRSQGEDGKISGQGGRGGRGSDGDDDSVWSVLLNTGGRCRLGGPYRLHVKALPDTAVATQQRPLGDLHDSGEIQPWVNLPNGLSAQLTRAAWYRLIDAATLCDRRAFIMSGGERIDLGDVDTG